MCLSLKDGKVQRLYNPNSESCVRGQKGVSHITVCSIIAIPTDMKREIDAHREIYIKY